jgi:sialate O-acetylesterase
MKVRLTVLLVFCTTLTFAQLRLPSLVSSGMVLQQNDSVKLWGWAGPDELVYVTTGWDNSKDSTRANNGAKWSLKIKTPKAGGPYKIDIKTLGNTTSLNDVLIGEVWFCSGQSNMDWSYYHGLKDIRAELPTCYNKNIRFFHILKTTSDYPQDDVKGNWETCDSTTLKRFSAVGYYFGKRINQQLNVPVGLIHGSWGGTPAETWVSDSYIAKDAALQEAAN